MTDVLSDLLQPSLRVVLCGTAAGTTSAAERAYYADQVEPLLGPDVEYIGQVGGADKAELLARAEALVNPIRWPEPFGLVMIEAMACGTPVIAFRRGSVPEVMVQGVTGFVVEDVAEAEEALGRVPTLSRWACRNTFVERFGAVRMATYYLAVYRKLVGEGPCPIAQGASRAGIARPLAQVRRRGGLLGPVAAVQSPGGS